jgi:DNA-binding Lrp family transcriptional regulator
VAKLDLKDRKLLYYLSVDARASDTQLAKRVGLSKNSVKYRTERLKKEGVIRQFACVTNLGALKLTTFTLLLKFNEDIYEKPEIIEYFRQHELADWAVTLSGHWDIFVEVTAKDFGQLMQIISGIITHFSGTLSTYQLFSSNDTLRVEHLIADFYEDLKLEPMPLKPRTKEKYGVDETDKRILHLLNQDSTLPYLTIAQKLGLTIDVVRYRMKNLAEKGILVKCFPEISLPALGYTEYLYTIKLKNASLERMDSINKRIQTNTNVTYAFVDITGFNIVFMCAFRSPDGIDHLSRNLRKDYSDIIDEQDYLIVKEQVLFNLFPKGLLQQ